MRQGDIAPVHGLGEVAPDGRQGRGEQVRDLAPGLLDPARAGSLSGLNGGYGGHCTKAGHPCMACTEKGYPDSFVPFVKL